MDAIKIIISDVIKSLSEKNVEHSGKIERMWQNIVSSEERKHSRVLGIKNGCVTIGTDSAVWLYSIRIQKKRLLELFQEECPEVKQLCFKLGKT